MIQLTIDQALIKGIEAHKAGKVTEADRYYTAILKAKPKHPDANHNMVVLAVGLGKVQESLIFFRTALETNDSIDQYWLSYIDALIKLNRMDDANAVWKKAKSKDLKGHGFDQIEKNPYFVLFQKYKCTKSPSRSAKFIKKLIQSKKVSTSF